ncbi:MAG: 3'-5' exonuclease [Gemmatimonadales bacterium]
MSLKPSFNKDLDALKRNSRKNYQRASEILQELQRGIDPQMPRRSESRLPNCVKYELADGYRLVLQRVDGDDLLIALCVGTHDHVDSFLDGHKGYVFDPVSGRLKELRLATAEETAIEVVPSAAVETLSSAGATPNLTPVFGQFSGPMFDRISVPEDFQPRLARITDPNSLDLMTILGELEEVTPQASSLLLAYSTGNTETRLTVLGIAQGELQLRAQLTAADLPAVSASSEEFVTFEDPAELAHVLSHETFEQWQLFLHPDQRALVNRRFAGPARIRGVSGSGKTVVALHRARRLAHELAGTRKRVLFTTYDKGLANAAGRLLDSLCGPERSAIDVTHLHRWCLDYIGFCGIPRPRYSPDESREVRGAALAALPVDAVNQLASLPREYLWNEIEFLMGRFLHENRSDYLTTDRSGRGRAITAAQRQAILRLYETYHRSLFERGYVEPAEFVRMAYRQRLSGDPTEADYAAIIVDEAQDISELGLRLLSLVAGDREDGLLLVGDQTQRIFTRGYSMRDLGIDIAGRSLILRKNYRNSRQILEAAFPLIATEWDSDAASLGIDPASVRPEVSVRDGHRPIIVRCKDDGHEAAFLAAEISGLLKYRHYTPRSICVMARNKYYRDLALRALKQSGIPATSFQRQPTGEVLGDEDAVRVSSLHAAKGHEYGAVIIVGAIDEVLPQRGLGETDDLSERALLYVAMTRARDIIYISHSEIGKGGKRRARSSLVDRIEAYCDICQYKHHPSHPLRPYSGIAPGSV